MNIKKFISLSLASCITFASINCVNVLADNDSTQVPVVTTTTTVATTEATTKNVTVTEPTTIATTVTEATTNATTVTEPTTQATTSIILEPTTSKEVSTEATTLEVTTVVESTSEITTTPVRPPTPGCGHLRRSLEPVYNKTTPGESSNASDAVASEPTNNVVVSIGSPEVFVRDKIYQIDSAPYIQAFSRATLVPLRFVSLALSGGDVDNALNSDNVIWNNDTKTATIKAGNKVVSFTASSDTMIVDGKAMYMDNGVKAEISNGRMYVPFRALGKALGVGVSWDSESKSAIYTI